MKDRQVNGLYWLVSRGNGDVMPQLLLTAGGSDYV
jgi:hypothetical protein